MEGMLNGLATHNIYRFFVRTIAWKPLYQPQIATIVQINLFSAPSLQAQKSRFGQQIWVSEGVDWILNFW